MSSGLGIGNIVLTFAFLLERLPDPAPVQFGGYTFLAEKGNIAVGPVKVTIPVKGTGVFDSVAALVGGK